MSPISAIPAVSQRTRGRSTVKGVGDVTRCKLEYALRTDDLQDGDVLLTPAARVLPQGPAIGRAVNVAKRPTGMFHRGGRDTGGQFLATRRGPGGARPPAAALERTQRLDQSGPQ